MNKIEATFRIVTPMFISGADQSRAELRAPSVKGALRFWWRALNWSRICRESDDSQQEALKRLREGESILFGDAGDSGQSKVLIRLKKNVAGNLGGNALLGNDVARKYLGYGLFQMGQHRERTAIARGDFSIEMLLKKGANAAQLEQCLEALGLLGGLGSRSRNGFGSVALVSLGERNFHYDDQEEYRNAIDSLLNISSLSRRLPPFTAISKRTEFIIGPPKNTPEEAHRHIGNLYRNFRTRYKHDRRKKYFGLPLSGYDENNRRASPLFFHIHPVGKQYVPVLVRVPAVFHPKYSSSNYSLVDSFVQEFTKKATGGGAS